MNDRNATHADVSPSTDTTPTAHRVAIASPEATAARKERLMQMRMKPRPSPVGTDPIPVQRARHIRGQEQLQRLTDTLVTHSLVMPTGNLLLIEEALGRGMTDVALNILTTSDVDAGTRADIQARAALMLGDVAQAKAILAEVNENGAIGARALTALAEQQLTRAQDLASSISSRGLADQYAKALVYVAAGDLQDAHDALLEVARAAPWHAVARYQLGQIMLATGDPARAGTLFEMAFELSPTFLPPALTLAEMLAESRQYGEALALLQNVCDQAPDAAGPRVLQLRILLELGERDTALQLAEALHERFPDDIDISLLLAEALLDGNNMPAAARLLVTAAAQATTVPQRQRTARLKARVLLAETPAQPAEALVVLRDGALLDGPHTGDLALEQFHVAWALGDTTSAKAALIRIVSLDDPSALISGAILARSHALFGEARQLGQKARQLVLGTPAEAQLDGFLAALPA